MSRLYGTCLVFALGAGCMTGEITGSDRSPSDPESFSSAMFDQGALAGYGLEDRAYVQGHAIAVYLYGKTLPNYTGHVGYRYDPGHSSPDARVPYLWHEVMVARSGGVDGSGGVMYHGGDDVECEGDDCDDTELPPCDDTEPPPDGDTEPPPDGDTEPPPDGDTEPPPDGDTETPPGDEECEPPDEIDPDCEEFLDPAAMDARDLSQLVDVQLVLGEDYPADTAYERAFRRGMAEALHLQDLNEDTHYSEVEAIKHEVQDEGMCEHSPLVLDLNGDGVAVGPVSRGVTFDLLARGTPVRTAWPEADDALLVLDWDGDGAITNGGELFGNTRRIGGGGRYANGFESLRVLDEAENGGNEDGVIDADDALFGRLQVWRDTDRDGVSSEDELASIAEVGIVSIDLGYAEMSLRDEAGNRLDQHGTFVRVDGDGGYDAASIVDVWFRTAKSR